MKGTQQMGSSGEAGEKKFEARIAGLEGENCDLRTESSGFQVRIRELDGLLDKAEREKREAMAEAAKFEGERDAARKEAEAKSLGLERNAEELGRSLEAGRAEINRLTAEVTRLQGEIATAKATAEAAQEAMIKAEAERAQLADRLEQMLKDKSALEKQLIEAMAAKTEAEGDTKSAFAEKVEADTARITAEQALATVKLKAERAEDALQRRIAAKDAEIQQLHTQLLKALSGK